MSRKQPNLREMLATALLQIPGHSIEFEEAKAMSPAEVIAKFELHHHVHVALGGKNTPALMSWMPKAEHRKRTRKIDIPAIAKVKRGLKKRAIPIYASCGCVFCDLDLKPEIFGARLMHFVNDGDLVACTKPSRPQAPKSKWPSRKMGSKTYRKKMDGSVVEKKR